MSDPLKVWVSGVGAAGVDGLRGAGMELVDVPDQVNAALISTRNTFSEIELAWQTLATGSVHGPIIALVHPGGEDVALKLLARGAHTQIAEGREADVAIIIKEAAAGGAQRLLEAYDSQLGVGDDQAPLQTAVDSVTGLPSRRQFEERIADLAAAGEVARFAAVWVNDWNRVRRRLSSDAEQMLRRRIAARLSDLTTREKVQLYSPGPGEFLLIGTHWPPTSAHMSLARFAEIVASYMPAGNETLELHAGHVGPELTSDPVTLADLAQRAVRLARSHEGSKVVGPADLARTLVPATEVEVSLRLIAEVEKVDPLGTGHGRRTAEIAGDLGERVGLNLDEAAALRLSAHLHHIGQFGMDPSDRPDPLSETYPPGYQAHPQRGAEMVAGSAGLDVAQAVLSFHERWDGQGFPRGLSGATIPLAARIVAVACAIERRLQAGMPTADLLGWLRDRAGSAYDPSVVAVCEEVVKRHGR